MILLLNKKTKLLSGWKPRQRFITQSQNKSDIDFNFASSWSLQKKTFQIFRGTLKEKPSFFSLSSLIITASGKNMLVELWTQMKFSEHSHWLLHYTLTHIYTVSIYGVIHKCAKKRGIIWKKVSFFSLNPSSSRQLLRLHSRQGKKSSQKE